MKYKLVKDNAHTICGECVFFVSDTCIISSSTIIKEHRLDCCHGAVNHHWIIDKTDLNTNIRIL